MGGKPRPHKHTYASDADAICKTCGWQRQLYAFWRYDSYPYVIGGAIDMKRSNINEMGYVPSFQGWFRPIKIVPLLKGKLIKGKLIKLRDERADKLRDIKEHYDAFADVVFGEPIHDEIPF